MSRPFVHLHNHTEYSLLDGASRIKKMVSAAKEMGMPALAITDHGVMFGAMEFYFECKSQGIKPLVGMEAYVSPAGHKVKGGKRDDYHLLLLAKNEVGYRNLCILHSLAALDGYYYVPRIDHEILRQHAKGLIGSTTCIGSEVNQALLANDYQKAQYLAGMYKEIFDEGSYFVELQDHGLPEQRLMNEGLLKIAKELKLPLAVTNDSHYLCREDAEPHDVLLAIGTGKLLSDTDRLKFKGPEWYIKTPEEMSRLFPHHPEAMENTLMIADMCDLQISGGRNMMPEPDLPEGVDSRRHLRDLAEQGLRDRVGTVTDESWQRLQYELEVIDKTGFDAYFLLVREFAKYTRDQGIMFGVRGSAAGSLTSYSLGITDVNPVEYDLTFERFLNPERISMPDIDMDFEDARRDEVIKWVVEKYGEDRVAQIVTFGTLGPKAAIRDSARVMGMPPSEADRVCKLIPTGPKWTIQKALDEVVEFRQAISADPAIGRLVDTAKSIEGISRHSGVHAAGVVISRNPLAETVPLYRGSDGQAITAYEMGILEKLGLLKMDFLGLSNLTVVAQTIRNIRQTHAGVDETKLLTDHPVLRDGIQSVPLDDKKAYEMLARGETTGVFQLESSGMRRYVMELKPENVRELAAMVALYRPGPLGEIPKFIASKFGKIKVEYLHEIMEPILRETYGVIVYQDQVLKLVQALAGFSLGKADNLRRAMGKKKKEDMDKMLPEYIGGCESRGIPKETAEKVWQLLEPFCDYAFNKAHAVCYAILAYQTAYLKANYTVEYMAALLACFRAKEDKVITFIEECRRQKIAIVPPDINSSQVDFSIEKRPKGACIKFGLAAIKGVGEGLAAKIIAERESKPFTHLFEFAERCRPFGLNRSSLEAMAKAGALSTILSNRKTLIDNLEAALAYADNRNRQKEAGQNSLFGGGEDDPAGNFELRTLPELGSYGRTETLAMEKEVLGIYVSDHPLRGRERAVRASATATASQMAELGPDSKVSLAGILSSVSHMTAKKTGARMAKLVLEDFTGQVTCMVFKDAFQKFAHLIEKDRVVCVKGFLSQRDGMPSGDREPELIVNQIIDLPASETIDMLTSDAMGGRITLSVIRAKKDQIEALRKLSETNPGDAEVVLEFAGTSLGPIFLPIRVAGSRDLALRMGHTLEYCQADWTPPFDRFESGTDDPLENRPVVH